MKGIQGKIKFGVIPMKKWNLDGLIEDDSEAYNSLTNEQMDNSIILSDITEEQATDFVEYYNSERVYRNYTGLLDEAWDCKTAKESLISLLKANDVWIKEWKVENNKGMTIWEENEYEQLPDDLLLIKL